MMPLSIVEGFDLEELERQYMPRLTVKNFQDYLDRSALQSAETRRRFRAFLDVRYGTSIRQSLDIFPSSKPSAPIHVFIHGGYWRNLDKAHYSFVADPFVAAGVTTIILDYDLCPLVTLPEIVRQCRAGLAWISRNAAEFGADQARLYVSGHSAGAHLAAMALAGGWQAEAGVPQQFIMGGCLISGIYDLEPLRHTSLVNDVHLTQSMAFSNSPIHHPPASQASIIVAVGGKESVAFRGQSRRYAMLCSGRELSCDYRELQGEHHFSVTDQLGVANSELATAILTQIVK